MLCHHTEWLYAECHGSKIKTLKLKTDFTECFLLYLSPLEPFLFFLFIMDQRFHPLKIRLACLSSLSMLTLLRHAFSLRLKLASMSANIQMIAIFWNSLSYAFHLVSWEFVNLNFGSKTFGQKPFGRPTVGLQMFVYQLDKGMTESLLKILSRSGPGANVIVILQP